MKIKKNICIQEITENIKQFKINKYIKNTILKNSKKEDLKLTKKKM